MNELYGKIIKALNNNNMNGYFAENSEDARKIVKEMLFDGATVAGGGSMSVRESGVYDIITSENYNYIDRNKSSAANQDKMKVYKDILDCDFYFCSSNAITQNGELVNVDGFANRVSAIAFGPEKVIMIVGKNKIVKDVNEGILRVKKTAAPKNCERLNIDNPCRKLGHCISLEKSDCPSLSDGCNLDTRICCEYLISAKQRTKGRINVILVDEDLGF